MGKVGYARVFLAAVACVLTFGTTAALSQSLDLNNTSGVATQMVTFTVSITAAPTAVGAFGFDIIFDPAILAFEMLSPDTLTANIDMGFLDANVITPGTLRIGGVLISDEMVSAITAGATGPLLRITFTVLASPPAECSMLTITNPVDDLTQTGWTLGTGQVCPSVPGDCNGDGGVNVADIISTALEIFDSTGTFPGTPGCDANGDGSVNVADIICTALLIFGNSCQ